MVPRTLILLLSIVSWLAGAQAARAISLHPISHTDAWVRVTTGQVDVRLNIFLDDVLRYEGLLHTDPDQLPRDAVVGAVERYSGRVLQQLQIFGPDGRPLRAELMAAPEWKAPADQVDLRANDLLKLTWKLRYRPEKDTELSLLSFDHQFTHPSLPAPGELRLHVQHQPTSRRLDAVVSPGRPHVLHLPADRSAVTGRDLNLMQVRMILNAGHISVELMAPAGLMNAALPPESNGVGANGIGVNGVGVNGVESNAAEWTLGKRQKFFHRWALANVAVRLNGRSVAADQIMVEFPELSPERRADTAKRSTELTEPDHWRTRLVGIRLSFPRPRRTESFALSVQSWPVAFDDVALEQITSESRASSLIATVPGDGPVFEHEWRPVLTEPDLATPDMLSVSDLSQKSLQLSEPNQWGRLTAGALVSTWLLLLGWRWRVLKSRMTTLVAASLLLLATAGYAATRVTYRSAAGNVQQYLQFALTQIYTSLQWNDEQAVVERLSAFMEPDVTEQTFLSAMGSLAADSREPVTTVLNLQVVRVDVRPPQTPGRLQCDCQWHVGVMIDHWGHAHRRQLNLSGTLELVQVGGRWRIGRFQPQSARFAENLPELADRNSDPAGA